MSTSRTSTTNTPLISYFMTACFLHPFPLLSSLFPPALSCPLLPQEKRATFPQYYFTSDEDLLEILGQSANPQVLQVHLKKLFAGISRVEFSEGNTSITAIKSQEGEVFPLSNPVAMTTNEVWLAN